MLEREREDLLRLAVLQQLEIVGFQAADDVPAAITYNDVDQDEVDRASKCRGVLLWLLCERPRGEGEGSDEYVVSGFSRTVTYRRTA